MIGIIADDLTGSGDVGLHFADCGLKTLIQVLNDEKDICEQEFPDVFIINTDSRSDESKTAYDKVRNACGVLKSMNADRIFKKIDSTLRGNIGPEIDALFDEFDIEAMPFCAAFPSMGRTTVKGRHYVNGKLITQTEFAGDPKNPVREAHIPTLLAEQTENNDWIIVCDAKTDEDIRKYAREIAKSELSVVVGSAGLAKEMVELWTGRKPAKSKNEPVLPVESMSGEGAPVLIVSGSRNSVTRNQIEKLGKESGIISIPINFSEKKVKIANWMDKTQETGASASGQLKGKSMMIYPDKSSSDVNPDVVMNVLSRLVLKLCEGGLFKNIILSGGDTALNVCKALKIRTMTIKRSVLPGVALCSDVEGRYEVILKPGGFGKEDTLVRCFNHFRSTKMKKQKRG